MNILDHINLDNLDFIEYHLNGMLKASTGSLGFLETDQKEEKPAEFVWLYHLGEIRQMYSDQKKLLLLVKSRFNKLKEDTHISTEQGAQIKQIEKTMVDMAKVSKQIFFLLDFLEERWKQFLIHDVAFNEAQTKALNLAVNLNDLSNDERQKLFESERMAQTSHVTRLHCPKCRGPMANVVFIQGDRIEDMERVDKVIENMPEKLFLETWIVAAPLEAVGQTDIVSYVMKVWPSKSLPEKMLASVFTNTVLKRLEDAHC